MNRRKKTIPRGWGRHGQKGVECYHILTRNKINDVKYCIPIYILHMTTPLIISQTTDDGFIMEITGCKIKMRTHKKMESTALKVSKMWFCNKTNPYLKSAANVFVRASDDGFWTLSAIRFLMFLQIFPWQNCAAESACHRQLRTCVLVFLIHEKV